MATKRIVPDSAPKDVATYAFKDGERQLPGWERMYLDDPVTVELTGKRLRDLTYQEWQEQVYSVMQVRRQFVQEVYRQRGTHFATRY